MMRGAFTAIWLGLVCSACGVYSIQQTSLVPPAVPSPIPAAARGPDLALMGTYVTQHMGSSGLKDASLWVTRGVASGTFEYSFRPASVRFTLFSAPGRGAVRAQPDGFAKPDGNVWGGGPGAVIRLIRDSDKNNLTLTGDLWLAVAPSRLESRCIEECDGATGGGRHTDWSSAFMFTTGLQYRLRFIDQLAFTASFALQTLVRNDELRERSELGGRSKVRMGAPHPLLDAGIELTPSPWVSVHPTIGWIGPPGSLRYGASAMLVVRLHVVKD
jgi:hypothetical protein